MIFEVAVIQHDASIGNDYTLRRQCVYRITPASVIIALSPLAAVVGGNADLGPRCFLGLNSTVRDGVMIPPVCLIGSAAARPRCIYTSVSVRLQTYSESK